ncbi:hypothetical protein HUJ05_001500, partial [Dendroctonus ponderosae]
RGHVCAHPYPKRLCYVVQALLCKSVRRPLTTTLLADLKPESTLLFNEKDSIAFTAINRHIWNIIPICKNNSVAPINQLLTALRYYASAGHLDTVADFIGMDKSTSSRIVAKVSRAIASIYPRFVKMPNQENLICLQADFCHIASFPRVIACVDGTHVRIQSPACSSDLPLLDVVARWLGSANNSTIFNNSRLRRRFENQEFPNCILL